MNLRKALAIFGALAFSFTASCRHAPPDAGAKDTLAQEWAETKKAGIPTTPAELTVPMPPASQNAAPVYQQAAQLLKTKPLSPAEIIIDGGLKEFPPSPEDLTQMRQALARHADLLLLIHQAASRPECVFKRDWSQDAAMIFPEFASLRNDMRILSSESLVQVCDGKSQQAIQTETLGFKIAHHATTDPMLIALLVGVAIDAITLRGMEHILYIAGNDPAVDDAVRKAIEQHPLHFSLAHGLRSEDVIQATEYARWRQQDPNHVLLKDFFLDQPPPNIEIPKDREGYKLFVDRNQATSLHLLRKLIAAADKPYLQSSPVFASQMSELEKNKSNPSYALARTLAPVYSEALGKVAGIEARTEVVRSAAAVLAWKARHGKLPTHLSEALSPVPVDPFDGKPLRYRLEGKGFVLYSVGETGKYDGSAKDLKVARMEAQFRYPRASYMK